jgi:hypothetical protein
MVIALLDEAARLARPWLQNIVESHGLINQENRIARIFFCLMTGLRLMREILFASATIIRRSAALPSSRSQPSLADKCGGVQRPSSASCGNFLTSRIHFFKKKILNVMFDG